jgi:hypothetical protein
MIFIKKIWINYIYADHILKFFRYIFDHMTTRCIQCLDGYCIIYSTIEGKHKQGPAVLLSLALVCNR